MKRSTANVLLASVSICWGVSYTLLKICSEAMPPFTLIFYRFLIGFAILAVFLYPKLKQVTIKTIKYSFIGGLMIAILLFLIILSLRYTTASTVGFLTSSSVAMVILIDCIIKRQFPSLAVAIGLAIVCVGLYLLTVNGEGLQLNFGAILCLLGALGYASHIHMVNYWSRQVEPVSFGTLQLGWVILFSACFAFGLDPIANPLSWSLRVWEAMLGLAIICTAYCFLIQTIAQKYSTAQQTGLLFTLEPVSSAFYASIILGELLTVRTFIGSALVIIGVVISMLFSYPKRASLAITKDARK